MNNLTVFQNNEFGEVRTVMDEHGEPWFVAKDILKCLSIEENRHAISDLEEDEKGVNTIHTPGGPQEMVITNEQGVYSLIIQSRKPEAKKFKRWLTHEVLPSIRKTGSYSLAPTNFLEALELSVKLEKERLQLEQKNVVMLPKAEMYDAVIETNDLMLMRVVAKLLGTGQNKLFRLLRNEGILMERNPRNSPYQTYVDRGYFEVKEILKSGFMVRTTYVTQKGLAYIQKRFF